MPSRMSQHKLPGHAIECGWFLLDYARSVGDDSLQALALQIIDWSFDAGWDPVHGGIFYFLDAKGYSPGPFLWLGARVRVRVRAYVWMCSDCVCVCVCECALCMCMCMCMCM